MRMWMVNPRALCRAHLLGEHVELHMLAGCLRRGKQLGGFVREGLLEPQSLYERHEQLAQEMTRRGFRHASPLDEARIAADLRAYPHDIQTAKVARSASLLELVRRCAACQQGFTREGDPKRE